MRIAIDIPRPNIFSPTRDVWNDFEFSVMENVLTKSLYAAIFTWILYVTRLVNSGQVDIESTY